jgi:hypothetical protein
MYDMQVNLMTEQMTAKKGLKLFGHKGAEAIVSEMHQLHYRKTVKPVFANQMTREDKRAALRYLMFLKQKRCGKIKARGCADGRKQRIYKTKEETSAPTVHIESLFLSSAIDALEGRKVMTADIPGAFMQADMDENLHMKLEGPLADLMTRVDPDLYKKYTTKENGKDVLYVKLEKALYGTVQAALLFWENLTTFLVEELGFVKNPYDQCVVNKIIDGKQCTILWHVDDLKLSHVDQAVLEDILGKLNVKYGKEAPLVVTRGLIHEYLGIPSTIPRQGKYNIGWTITLTGYWKKYPTKCPEPQ